MSICASNQHSQDPRKNYVIMTSDIKRAYFYAPATRSIFIKIPREDWEDGDDERVGELNLSLYGARDAAMNWAKTYSNFLVHLGFEMGRASPCNFYHPARAVSVTVHAIVAVELQGCFHLRLPRRVHQNQVGGCGPAAPNFGLRATSTGQPFL